MNLVEDGDYAKIHFYFKSNDLSDLGEVYLYGEFTDWQLQEQYKMDYFP